MAVIESMNIQGFWGNHIVQLGFDRSVNFLVGRNGSGKTTAIEILASVISCDEDSLARLPFEKVEIVLFDRVTRRKPSIIVERLGEEDFRYAGLRYTIRPNASASTKDLRVFWPFIPQTTYVTERSSTGRAVRRRNHRTDDHFELRRAISALIKANWLSINRVSTDRPMADRGVRESTVDLKLREISERLVRYFSELTSQASQQTRDFQRKLFRSLIRIDSIKSLNEVVTNLNIKAERSALTDIFERFGIPEQDYQKESQRFFKLLNVIQSEEDKSAYSHDDLVAIVNAQKIHYLVGEWNDAVKAERESLKPRDAFVAILNRMLHRKTATVLASGEFEFKTPSGKSLSIFDLSSGEKQLFIILAEALLQREAEWTYIADEPELSLHVDWQEVLVDNLRALNPNGQVIFATHSPDIVGRYSNYVIQMEGAIE